MKSLSLDAYTLKIIAITSMGVHHAAMVLWEIVPLWIHIPLGFIRGVTFPIMAFFVVEGFRRTSNVKRYMLRLLLFGAVAQIPYMLAFGVATLNIVFTILVGLICLVMQRRLYVEKGKKGLFVVLFIIILIASNFVVEGGFAGLLMIFLFNVIRDEQRRRTVPLIVWGAYMVFSVLLVRATAVMLEAFVDVIGQVDLAVDAAVSGVAAHEIMLMTEHFILPVGTFLIIPLLRAYNGDLGKRAKYLFYSFYPLHFIVLVAIGFALRLIDGFAVYSPFFG
ncbi:MAG: conjugal transfer protein TraX [Oscillospiraceae bacterium]|nr:conjugal transfer protein TraX [Oscillospiraceae bacterium]